jgi:hypothetical protein
MRFLVLAGLLAAALAGSGSAHALTMEECSAKYKAAQAAGTLGDVKWNDFRKASCTDPAPAATPVASAPAAPAAASGAVFPTAIAPSFSAEKPARARLHTCAAQFKANKAANANGGLRWIEKGGGYYSQCNARLKG